MRKRLKAYLEYLEKINFEELEENELIGIKNDLLIQTGFFQHERLIHLIVTALFALLTFISLALGIFTGEPAVFILCAALIVLLIPYIGHYYFLENGVQKLYTFYDRIIEKEKNL